MATAADYKAQFYKRLPRGRGIWPESEGEKPGWDKLIGALTRYAADMDAAALDVVAEALPDTTDAVLDRWLEIAGLPETCEAETWDAYTAAQKRAALVAKLRGRGSVAAADLEAEFQTRLADTNASLQAGVQLMQVGVGGVGQGVGGPAWAAAWILEYMPDVLVPGPDDLDAWTQSGATTINNSVYQSPATEAQTAADVFLDDLASGEMKANLLLSDAADHEVHFSIWIRTQGSPAASSVRIYYEMRDGGTSTPDDYELTNSWVKISHSALIGVGATTPRVVIQTLESGGASYRMSWAFAGSRQSGFECYAESRVPLHTRGIFAVIGEYP